MNIDTGTITRVIIFILAWINQWLATKNMSPIQVNDEDVNNIILGAVTVWTLYKNNNFTKAAKEGQKKIHEVKSGKDKQNTGSPVVNEGDIDDI